MVKPQQPEVWNAHRSRNKRAETHGVGTCLSAGLVSSAHDTGLMDSETFLRY